MDRKKKSNSKAYAGAAGFVIAAAAFGALLGAARAQGLPAGAALSPEVAGSPEAGIRYSDRPGWTIPQVEEERDPHLLSDDARRYAAWAALAGIAGSLVAILGANRILQLVASLGQALGRWGKKAAEAPVKVAKSAAKATVKIIKKPGRWLGTVIGLAIFAITGIAFFDVQWEAGLIAGAGMGAAAAWGWQKTGTMVSRRWQALRGHKEEAAVAG